MNAPYASAVKFNAESPPLTTMRKIASLLLLAVLTGCTGDQFATGTGALLTGYGRGLSESSQSYDSTGEQLRQIELNQLNAQREQQWEMRH